jgi:hypothetical protein
MALTTTTLTITIYGGLAPEPIDVTLYQGSIKFFNQSYAGPSPFIIPFMDLVSGLYGLYINGKNPLNPDGTINTSSAATKCEITTNNITLMPMSDQNPELKKGAQYMIEYHFTV